MTTALGISSWDSDGRTFSSRDGEPNFISCGVGIHALDSSTHLDGFAGVIRAIIVHEADVFQMMGPDGEGSGADRFSIVASSCQGVVDLFRGITTYSCPVLRITSLMLCLVANAIPAAISAGMRTSMA